MKEENDVLHTISHAKFILSPQEKDIQLQNELLKKNISELQHKLNALQKASDAGEKLSARDLVALNSAIQNAIVVGAAW